jgi:hypothetical protein
MSPSKLFDPLFSKDHGMAAYGWRMGGYLSAWWICTCLLLLVADPDPMESSGHWLYFAAFALVVSPIVENFLFLPVVWVSARFMPDHRWAALVAAMVAVLVHALIASWRAVAALGGFYVFAACLLTWEETNPRFAFWAGVAAHAAFNLIAMTLIFIGWALGR